MSIIARNLSKTFDGGKTFALQGVSIDVQPGEFIAVIGLSGAGKSTFLRAINGVHVPSGGHMEVLGRAVEKLSRKELVLLRSQIGFIFQQFNLVKSLTAMQNVLCGRVAYVPRWRALTGWFGEENFQLAREALDSVGLSGRYTEKVRNLSGGQQQRVAIARALVQQPKIILADEPMASLDPKLAEVVLEILSRINRERGITVLVNIHVLELARKFARRVIAFRKGHLVFDGAIDTLNDVELEKIYTLDSEEAGHH